MRKSKWHIIIPFTLPSLLLFLVFLVYPYGQAMYISLTKWRGLTPKPTYIGLANFEKLLGDALFWNALKHNLIYLVSIPAITIIISFIGWTGLARQVRGRFLAMREEDFVTAARLYGTSRLRIIFRHMLPLFVSHIIASVTLAVPTIIIGETALSFLGIGLRQPAISLGVMLVEAQNVRSIALTPWVLVPGLIVILIVLSFNFIGDGLRDAADPYGRGG